MRCLSLKTELSWLIGLLMLVTLAINLCVLIVHAGPRIRAEDETSVHLTRELVVTAIGSLRCLLCQVRIKKLKTRLHR